MPRLLADALQDEPPRSIALCLWLALGFSYDALKRHMQLTGAQ